MSINIEKDLENSIGDHLQTGAKVLIASIPGVGGAASELFNMIIAPPIEKRRDEWLVKLYYSLQELQEKVEGFDIQSLTNNDLFISTIMNATQLSIRNHQEEKLRALHNAVINSALKIAIDENEQQMFLNLIDSFTSWHLKLVYYLENPDLRFTEKGIIKPNLMSGGITSGLYAYYAELENRDDFVRVVFKDLFNNGIINTESIGGTMSPQGIFASRLTDYGKRFLKYIQNNIE